MKKYRLIVLGLLGLTILSSSSCFFEAKEIKMVKEGHLALNENKTVGEAMDDWFDGVKWEKIEGGDGDSYVNVSGTMMYDGDEVEGLIQFSTNVEAGTFEAVAFELNDIGQSRIMLFAVLAKIFE